MILSKMLVVLFSCWK